MEMFATILDFVQQLLENYWSALW